MAKLLIFGMGYVGQHLASAMAGGEFEVIGTNRDATGQTQIKWNAAESKKSEIDAIAKQIPQADAILCSIPPDENGDVAHRQFAELIENSGVKWLGYLSTTGVYGDHEGGAVDEATPLNAQNPRAIRRLIAEQQWMQLLGKENQTERSVNVFRLPGIYGAGRSAFDAINSGRAKRIDMRLKNGAKHFFCRAHVDDIVQTIIASLEKQLGGVNVYNIADDEPTPQADIVEFAAALMDVAPPKLVAEQQANMSDIAKSFYAECKNIGNDKIKTELGVKLKYPTYKQGLTAIWQEIKS